MNGDLGNLLTGEMGEAEARFADDDFAEAYGSRVMGRVRRRRDRARTWEWAAARCCRRGARPGRDAHAVGRAGCGPGGGGNDCVTPSP